jgi:hypothetical protein
VARQAELLALRHQTWSCPMEIKVNLCAIGGPIAAGIFCASSATPMPRDTCKMASTSARCRGGWAIVTSP